jgi:hypothetical protein
MMHSTQGTNAIFSWQEVSQDDDKVVVSIATNQPGVRIDLVTAEAMAATQQEIVAAYPSDKLLRMLINTEGLYLDARLIQNVIRPEFILSLVKLSSNFNMIILYGKQAVQTVAQTLSGIVPGKKMKNLHVARDQAEALRIANRYILKKK